MPPPAPGVASGAPRLYLDQFVWVSLLRGGPDATRRCARLAEAVAEGSVVVCLAAAHWIETWHRGGWESRWGLARLLWDASRLHCLSPMNELLPREVASALRGVDVQVPERTEASVLGTGVNHAFACETGRLRLVEWVSSTGEEGPPVLLGSVGRRRATVGGGRRGGPASWSRDRPARSIVTDGCAIRSR